MSYKTSLAGGGTYAPPWRGATGPDYWKYSHSPYYLKQLDRYWEGVGDEWTEEFPYHGLAALSSVLEHVESRGVGFGAQLAAYCPRYSESDPGTDDVCRSSVATEGIVAEPAQGAVLLEYFVVPEIPDPMSSPVGVFPRGAPSGTLDVALSAHSVSTTQHIVHSEDNDNVKLAAARSEDLALSEGVPVVLTPGPEFVIPCTVAPASGGGYVVTVDYSGWSSGAQHSAPEILGERLFSEYTSRLSGTGADPASAWAAACGRVWEDYYGTTSVEVDVSVGVS